jgi:NADPH-dependent 2,4-dienoyl-CoA reductase/sulfur reductase-like enzyme/nitrite reductase/ring-hydroxylating ferredoxin subunit
MGGATAELSGPDFSQGVAVADVPEGGTLLGHAGGDAVVLARAGSQVFAIGATCTHYGGPLAEGLVVGTGIRCPWHHACFDLATGTPVNPPALNPIACYDVQQRGDRVVVLGKREHTPAATAKISAPPARVVIIGAGAAGNAAAETLRHEGYDGPIVLISADPDVPVDRPNLSKDYLAGTAQEEWIPLRGRDFYDEQRIELRLGVQATALDPAKGRVELSDGTHVDYGALILATGAEPIRLPTPGADLPHVHTLRSLSDSRAIIDRAKTAKKAVVIGASFIGLEAAASLRTRGIEVVVVAPEARPLERVLGPELGDFVRKLHEEHGVVFRLGHTGSRIEPESVTLDDGETLAADLVVMGVGVRPRIALAEAAGLRVDKGVVVNAYLESSAPGIYAAGDIARYPDPQSGSALIRIEHWVVAERQGQAAARNALGRRQPFHAVPFFWSQHYDVPIAYVGHADAYARIDVAGNIGDRNCVVAYRNAANRILAIASIYRDRESLEAEAAFERDDQPALEAILDRVRKG